MEIQRNQPGVFLCLFEGTAVFVPLRFKLSYLFFLMIIIGIALPRIHSLFIDSFADRLGAVVFTQAVHTHRLFAVDRANRPVFTIRIQINDISLFTHDAFEFIEAA